MKDLKPEEEVELIDMLVPIGRSSKNQLLTLESPDDSVPGTEEAPPPEAFQYYNWDE